MVIYLDQNKWIELARVFHGKDAGARATSLLGRFEEAVNEGRVTFPLASVHYGELSRVSNAGRKARLGVAMWHFSKGVTLIGYPEVVRYELEVALSAHLPEVVPRASRTPTTNRS